jgi:hypothetical protein
LFNPISANPIASIYPEYKSVITCDFTHNSNFKWFAPFFNKIISILNLTPNNEESKIRISLGVDPEFEVLVGNNVINAPMEFKGKDRLRGKIGTDGSGNQVELRTTPHFHEDHVVKEVKESFTRLRKGMMGSKGDKYPLGAHIHFGATINGIQTVIDSSSDFSIILDSFLGRYLVDLSGKARILSEYAAMGTNALRKQPHGFEYRSLPSAIFTDPKIARIVLKIARNLAQNYFSGKAMTINRLKADEEDFKNYCQLTPVEHKYFIGYSNIFKKRSGDILKYWVNKKKTKTPEITFKFYGDFSEITKKKYMDLLKQTIVPCDITIVFYPIDGNERISGIPGYGGNVSHPVRDYENEGIAFGLGSSYRNQASGVVCEQIKAKLGCLFEVSLDKEVTTANYFPEEIDVDLPQIQNQGLDIRPSHQYVGIDENVQRTGTSWRVIENEGR